MNSQALHVRIISPQQIILEADAESISSKNLKGSFDILPQHANFITVVENFPIIIRVMNQKPQTFQFPIAIIHSQDNRVNIYTYIQPQIKK